MIINRVETRNPNMTLLTRRVTQHDTTKLTGRVDQTRGNHGFCFKIFTFFLRAFFKKKKKYKRVDPPTRLA